MSVHRIGPGRDLQPASLPENDLARRVMLQQTVAAMLEFEPPSVQSDADRLALLQSRLGDVAHAFLHGHADIDDAVMHLCVTAQAWLEIRARERAR